MFAVVTDLPTGPRRPCSVEGCARPVGLKGARGWCPRHYQRWLNTGSPTGTRRASQETRFFGKVIEVGDCWVWTSALDKSGYGLFKGDRMIRSRIWSYEFFVGPIPEGLQLDHLCRNRPCCNPWHLDPVTPLVNSLRGLHCVPRTHCPQGHPYDSMNTYINPKGRKICRRCSQAARTRYETKKRSAA